jgi:HEAT repeat protein
MTQTTIDLQTILNTLQTAIGDTSLIVRESAIEALGSVAQYC